MSDPTPADDVLLVGLIGNIETLTGKVGELTKAHNRHRTLVRGVVVGLVLDAVLSVVYFVGLDRVNDANKRTDAVIERLVAVDEAAAAVCLASNESAAKQHQLWEGLIALPTDEPSDPEQLARFRALLADTFPQRDCG